MLSFIAAIGALVLVAPATAVAPTTVTFEVNRTRVLPASETGGDFDVVRHSDGTYYVAMFSNADGSWHGR